MQGHMKKKLLFMCLLAARLSKGKSIYPENIRAAYEI
jgi:hypothetical protein